MIAAIPSMLSFPPTRSLVVITLRHRDVAGGDRETLIERVARFDLCPDPDHPLADLLADALRDGYPHSTLHALADRGIDTATQLGIDLPVTRPRDYRSRPARQARRAHPDARSRSRST
ncbi:DUF4192 family protein [Nocardia cyriacigeorgica]|uniref:DUF4192 family protein n=1 Tax=Nocardia cyriacigeorgica TaxID=135487 RepID=UPI001486DB13|nr:DUF4192 family protein [Nocardia cyriacigeorgica]